MKGNILTWNLFPLEYNRVAALELTDGKMSDISKQSALSIDDFDEHRLYHSWSYCATSLHPKSIIWWSVFWKNVLNTESKIISRNISTPLKCLQVSELQQVIASHQWMVVLQHPK